jgi:four helix bundle protein
MSNLRFENLDVWQKSAKLCIDIYSKINNTQDYVYRNQVTRSALSISSNIAEGFERESDRDCLRFLYYAKGSCGELISQIYIGMQIKYIEMSTGKKWLEQTIHISSMLSGLIKTKKQYLKNK